jgi:catechol 2,3-dioxygenase-like lactoylglutathione lyase family enzyme
LGKKEDHMKLKLHEVELNAKDPEASKKFYHGILGLPIGQDQKGLKVFDSGWPNLDFDASMHHPGQVSVSFLVRDLDQCVAGLRAEGLKVEDPKPVHLGMRAVVLVDPDGHRVAIQTPTETSPDWLKKMI